MSFKRVLVANRGEIACRVIRTLKSLGIEAATVYSEADRGSPHVRLADHALLIGPAPAQESYLSAPRVLAAARALGCDALHPGYGFLAENAAFAAACADAGICFIGPEAEAIRVMGSKSAARLVAARAGVAPVPGYDGDDDTDEVLVREGERIGFPLMVKASAGGGGKGMRVAACAEELPVALRAARREAQGAFGDGRLLLERQIHPARHVEVQIVADGTGAVSALFERECSLQRRHQKVVEECPSPAVGPAMRRRISDAACRLVREVGYLGVGTVEFLLEEERGEFWFLEMNTRLQVEHGVTELVCGLDLVALQVRIAAGEPLPVGTDAIAPRGHAIEVRIYAEDPGEGFLPQAGTLDVIELPQGPGLRIDSGVTAGQEITPHYDPLLLKMMALGENREEARRRLQAALRETRILGVTTNLEYLQDVLAWPGFIEGATYTHSLETEGPAPDAPVPEEVLWLAAAALEGIRPQMGSGGESAGATPATWSPFTGLGPFRLVETEGAP